MEKLITAHDAHWETSKALTFKLAARTNSQVCVTAPCTRSTREPQRVPQPYPSSHTPRFK